MCNVGGTKDNTIAATLANRAGPDVAGTVIDVVGTVIDVGCEGTLHDATSLQSQP